MENHCFVRTFSTVLVHWHVFHLDEINRKTLILIQTEIPIKENILVYFKSLVRKDISSQWGKIDYSINMARGDFKK